MNNFVEDQGGWTAVTASGSPPGSPHPPGQRRLPGLLGQQPRPEPEIVTSSRSLSSYRASPVRNPPRHSTLAQGRRRRARIPPGGTRRAAASNPAAAAAASGGEEEGGCGRRSVPRQRGNSRGTRRPPPLKPTRGPLPTLVGAAGDQGGAGEGPPGSSRRPPPPRRRTPLPLARIQRDSTKKTCCKQSWHLQAGMAAAAGPEEAAPAQ